MISDRELRFEMTDDTELRKRLRGAIVKHVPNFALRGVLFQVVDRAPHSTIHSMRQLIRELAS